MIVIDETYVHCQEYRVRRGDFLKWAADLFNRYPRFNLRKTDHADFNQILCHASGEFDCLVTLEELYVTFIFEAKKIGMAHVFAKPPEIVDTVAPRGCSPTRPVGANQRPPSRTINFKK
jgi:hypothetical protein